jgi:hypothetical protein
VSRVLFLLAIAAALASVACGNDSTPTSPTGSEVAVNATSRLFTGALGPGGAQFYSSTVAQDSGVFVTLAGLSQAGSREASTERIGLGLGVPRGTGCDVASAIVADPGLAAQVREWTTKGVHCVVVYDPGTLAADVAFAVRIRYFP